MRVKMIQGVTRELPKGGQEKFHRGCTFNVPDDLGQSWVDADPQIAHKDGEELRKGPPEKAQRLEAHAARVKAQEEAKPKPEKPKKPKKSKTPAPKPAMLPEEANPKDKE